MAATLSEMKVQRVFLAEEIKSDNVEQHRVILDLLDTDVEVVYIAHDELKKMSRDENNIATVRTGETTAFSNIILESNVDFTGEAIK